MECFEKVQNNPSGCSLEVKRAGLTFEMSFRLGHPEFDSARRVLLNCLTHDFGGCRVWGSFPGDGSEWPLPPCLGEVTTLKKKKKVQNI